MTSPELQMAMWSPDHSGAPQPAAQAQVHGKVMAGPKPLLWNIIIPGSSLFYMMWNKIDTFGVPASGKNRDTVVTFER